MTPLQIAALYVVILTLMLLVLQVRVILLRRGRRIGLGDGGDRDLLKAMRVHANFTETVPFGIALLILMGLMTSPAWAIHLVGLLLVVSRFAHAYGLTQSSGSSAGRVVGMIGTNTALILGALFVAMRAFGV